MLVVELGFRHGELIFGISKGLGEVVTDVTSKSRVQERRETGKRETRDSKGVKFLRIFDVGWQGVDGRRADRQDCRCTLCQTKRLG